MDAALLRERVNAALEKEHYVTQLQKQTSQDITLESFADCEGFPIDEQGQLQCDDMAELESLNAKLNLFFQYDSQLAGGRAQQMWPLDLVMAYPFMQGWSLADMIIALCLRAWSNRKCGKATLQCGVLLWHSQPESGSHRAGIQRCEFGFFFKSEPQCLGKAGTAFVATCINLCNARCIDLGGMPLLILCCSVPISDKEMH